MSIFSETFKRRITRILKIAKLVVKYLSVVWPWVEGLLADIKKLKEGE